MPAAPKLLSIDTATEFCSVALLSDGQITQLKEELGQRHSERVLPMIDALLKSRGRVAADLDAIAFGAGPGSFTGLRIACGIAQGLAFGVACKLLPVGNLRALAGAAFAEHPLSRRVLVAIDARMNEAYCAVYERGDELIELRPPALAKPALLSAIAQASECDLVAGEALAKFADAWPERPAWQSAPELRADAAAILAIARVDLAAGRAVAPEDAMPLYVRDRVALTVEQRRVAATL